MTFVVVPAGTVFAYKILPHDTDSHRDSILSDSPLSDSLSDSVSLSQSSTIEDAQTHGQGLSDWSALYAQFYVQHAVSYLPNHWDRGHTRTRLVRLIAKREIACLVCRDRRLSISQFPSAEKAAIVREFIARELKGLQEKIKEKETKTETESQGEKVFATAEDADITNIEYFQAGLEGLIGAHWDESGKEPLLKQLGEQLQCCLVLFDADEDLECAIPHSLVTSDRFECDDLVEFLRDPVLSCRVKEVSVLNKDGNSLHKESLILSKDERGDASMLGAVLQDLLRPSHEDCVWFNNKS